MATDDATTTPPAAPATAGDPASASPSALALARRVAAEALGTGALVATVVGSGIMASRLSPGDVGLQLLENALATGFVLAVIIAVLGPVSGAHLNPVVSVLDAIIGGRPWRDVVAYLPAQVVGGVGGAIVANLMFGEPAVSISTTDRLTPATAFAEVVATAGLVTVIFVLVRLDRAALVAPAVGAYIAGAYFLTSSTSFANPAVTVGRIFSDSFAGIAPGSAPGFLLAQVAGAALGLGVVLLVTPRARRAA